MSKLLGEIVKINQLMVVFLFFIATTASSENSSEYNSIRCFELFNSIDPTLNKNEGSLSVYKNLKLIVPSLGNLKKATEMSAVQKIEMEENIKELIKLGSTEEILKQTRVERFEIKGQVVDVFVYPDGEIHHISNYLTKDKNFDKKPILKVQNCRVEH